MHTLFPESPPRTVTIAQTGDQDDQPRKGRLAGRRTIGWDGGKRRIEIDCEQLLNQKSSRIGVVVRGRGRKRNRASTHGPAIGFFPRRPQTGTKSAQQLRGQSKWSLLTIFPEEYRVPLACVGNRQIASLMRISPDWRVSKMATQLCEKCKQAHPGRVCDFDEKGECAETTGNHEITPAREASKDEADRGRIPVRSN
jgi:hypothetical protein